MEIVAAAGNYYAVIEGADNKRPIEDPATPTRVLIAGSSDMSEPLAIDTVIMTLVGGWEEAWGDDEDIERIMRTPSPDGTTDPVVLQPH